MIRSDSYDDTVQTASLNRRKGDALASRERTEEASKAYEVALAALDRELGRQSSSRADAAELLGMRGGLLRRLGRLDDALASYRQGGKIEKDESLPTTYNRSNAIKLGLIAGPATLDDLQGELAALSDAIEQIIRGNEQAASDAWTFADLGDTYLLLGDVPRAIDAYRIFNQRARSDSPTTTLAVLQEIGRKLEARHDPRSARFLSDLQHIEAVLPPRAERRSL
jgi:tetratricopeptide (TPR) repeat protein